MRLSRLACLLLGGAAAVVVPGVSWASPPEPVPGLIVKLRVQSAEGGLTTPTQFAHRRARLAGLSRSAGYPGTMPWRHLSNHMVSIQTPTPLTPAVQARLIDKLKATGQVEWVEPNQRQWLFAEAPQALPNDTYLSAPLNQGEQWWVKSAGVEQRHGVPNVEAAWAHLNKALPSGNAFVPNGPVVAVLDTGYAPHEDLPTPLPGIDLISEIPFAADGDGVDLDPTDPGDGVTPQEAASDYFRQFGNGCGASTSSWHGMVIAGLIGARTHNNTGMAGLNWNARLLPVRVAGKCGADLDDIIAGLRWAAGLSEPAINGVNRRNPNPARVINLSFGGDGACGPSYQSTIDELRGLNPSVVVVAAAGNEHGAVSRPGNCQNVVAVAALNRWGFKTTYSNFGPQVTVASVGGDLRPQTPTADGGAWAEALGDTGLLSVYRESGDGSLGNFYALLAGTSFAAPMASGVISLMLEANPSLTVAQVIAGLRASARPHVRSAFMAACSAQNPGRCLCTTSTCGAGILDALQAVRYAQSPSTYANPNTVGVNLDSDPVTLAALQSALTAAPQDRPANEVAPGTSITGVSPASGGGGSVGLLEFLGLALLGVWGISRRSR